MTNEENVDSINLAEEGEKVIEKEEPVEKELIKKDVYATAEEADARAGELGGKGSHEMKLDVDGKRKRR